MKFADKSAQLAQLRQAQKATKEKSVELYLARGKHKAMKRTFRGIYSYPQRKILYKVGQRRAK